MKDFLAPILALTTVGLIGFYVGDGYFGERLINAFEWVIYIPIISLTLYAISFTLILFVTPNEIPVKNKVLLKYYTVIFPFIHLLLIDRVISSINYDATSFATLTDLSSMFTYGAFAIFQIAYFQYKSVKYGDDNKSLKDEFKKQLKQYKDSIDG